MKKKRFLLLLFVLIAAILLIATNLFTVKVLSAVRAYINGEAEYSRGQKDACLYLFRYVQTGDTAVWQSFKQAIQIPVSDNIARAGLIKNASNEVITNSFLMGRNHPDDVDEMIWLFRNFRSVSFMKEPIRIWASAEPLVNALDSIGGAINEHVKGDGLTEAMKRDYTEKIIKLSGSLSKMETAFSLSLGQAERNIKGYLIYVNIFLVVLMLGNIALYATIMINRLSASEKALQEKNTELNNTNKDLEQFAYIASHDLQEPLRMIAGFLGLFQKKYDGQLDEQAKNYIHFAIDGAKRMKTLISDLLEYSKAGITAIEYEMVDLNEIATVVKSTFENSIADSGGLLHIAVLPQIRANKSQLLQVFQNLTGNALKYKSELPPEIYIGFSETATHWSFSVQDNGMGIDPEYYERIFVVFQRLQTRESHSGTGIGLAICKKIVERHGGSIWVYSEPGKGSTFFFNIAKNL